MIKYKKSPRSQYLEERNFWYAALMDEGFHDIERVVNGAYLNLKIWHFDYWRRRAAPVQFQAHRRYYELATHFLTSDHINSSLDYRIWSLYADGVPERQIAERLKTTRWQIYSKLIPLKKSFILYLKQELAQDEISLNTEAAD